MIGEPPICAECQREFSRLQPSLQPIPEASPLAVIACLYAFEGRPAQAIRRLKYNRVRSYSKLLAQELADFWTETEPVDIDAIIPVPIAWQRRFFRGFNQSEDLIQAFPPELVRAKWLRRIRNTKPQASLSARERGTNLVGAFRAAPEVSGKHILLVDDVTTTGGTAVECAKALLAQRAASVSLLTYCGERAPR